MVVVIRLRVGVAQSCQISPGMAFQWVNERLGKAMAEVITSQFMAVEQEF